MPNRISGTAPFQFTYTEAMRTLPERARAKETALHGSFAVDRETSDGDIYYGMPEVGLLRVRRDLTGQEIIDLPPELRPVNFHSTKIGTFDGKRRLFLAANKDAMVAVVTLNGDVDYVLPAPEFEQYQAEDVAFCPTDTTIVGTTLYVADGYGANYINTSRLGTGAWEGIFGGKTDDPAAEGKFGTAHGLNPVPAGTHLAVADRPHSRFQILTPAGGFVESKQLPAGSKPCGIDFFHYAGRSYAAVGSLDDPVEGRPAPIYILDGETFNVISTVRPKEELAVRDAEHIHNVVWHEYNGNGYLICQAWNPGYYFVLELA